MRSCVYCKRSNKQNSEISFHRFPKDSEERKLWLQNMKITNWMPKTYHTLCSLHFTDECFNKQFNKILLKPGSIPTIFEGISTCPSLPHPSTSSTKSANLSTVSAKQKVFCGAINTNLSDKTKSSDVSSRVDTLKKERNEFELLDQHLNEITQARKSLKISKAESKALRQQVQRLKLKLANMKSVMKDLVLKNKVPE